ncbi:DUF2384 domain-containing protein [Thiococcus pfennigii]|jgi:hypothetical protein|uniref:DUF2384 domain-containing protein n=1 Tax=Thiococcus pfennigii TaxID=1057 RepID=UPI0019046DF9|nr:DUF2384 domain-containing protein [Thiococcus pfennigii]MBK1700684.1 DUF2384 domain-containing protein [Thiococcus pfennigii]MBK1730323.1 DUF2384 domain-containing protein [Thiococcus pfennigii]
MSDLTPDERRALTQRAMSLLDGWRLPPPQIAALLDLPDGIRSRAIGRFRDGEALPDEAEVNRRLHYLLRIEDALRTSFPRSPEMRDLWILRGNRRFGRRTPLAVMLEDGESGFIAVLSHLDCTFAWDLTGSKTRYGAA